MCLYPRFYVNKKYVPNWKNGGYPPPMKDKRTAYIAAGCGECIECREKKAREWRVRMLEEIKHDQIGKFVTLTFTNKSLEKLRVLGKRMYVKNQMKKNGIEKNSFKYHRKLAEGIKRFTPHRYQLDNLAATIAVRLFLERWRKKFGKSVKHWLITELGHEGTERIHLHGIIWTDKINEVEERWGYGMVWKGYEENGMVNNYVNERTVNYIMKYVTKIDFAHREYRGKILCSDGIGKGYMKTYNATTNKFNGEKTKEYYTDRQGNKMTLPTYMRNHIYSEEEKEQLWIQLLNKETRYIRGVKIDVSKGFEQYYRIREHHKNESAKLGYYVNKNYNYQEYHETMVRIQKEGWKQKEKEKIEWDKEYKNSNNEIIKDYWWIQ